MVSTALLFKEEASPYAVLNVETARRDGDVDVRVLAVTKPKISFCATK